MNRYGAKGKGRPKHCHGKPYNTAIMRLIFETKSEERFDQHVLGETQTDEKCAVIHPYALKISNAELSNGSNILYRRHQKITEKRKKHACFT